MNHEDVIRRVLEAEASTVEVRPDALGEIRGRIDSRARRTRRWFPVVAAATATVAAVAVGVATCSPPRQQTPPVPPAAPTSAPTVTSAIVRLPVYYLGADGRLFREFHPMGVDPSSVSGKVTAAVTDMARDNALDPDYSTAWPAGTEVRFLAIDDDTVTIDLTQAPPNAAALRQLVWTVTAVSGLPEVQLRVDGRPVGEPMRRGPALDELAPVWLVDPQEGAVSGPEIEVYVYAVAFEATVQIRVKQGERTVYEGFVTLDKGAPQRGEARTTLPALAPGEYTVEAYTVSAEDGSEQGLDAHTVTVR